MHTQTYVLMFYAFLAHTFFTCLCLLKVRRILCLWRSLQQNIRNTCIRLQSFRQPNYLSQACQISRIQESRDYLTFLRELNFNCHISIFYRFLWTKVFSLIRTFILNFNECYLSVWFFVRIHTTVSWIQSVNFFSFREYACLNTETNACIHI